MKVAVTGGTGFIGSRVVRILRERGHEVVCLVRRPERAGALAALGATLAPGDILDRESLRRAFAGCQGVLHIAASYQLGLRGRRAEQMIRQNLEGTRLALEAAREAGADKIVYTSSIVVYGTTEGRLAREGERPQRIAFPTPHPSLYSYSKAQAHYEVVLPLIEAGAPIVIVQPGSVMGPRDHSVFHIIWKLLARGLPVVLGDARFGFVGVEDCALGHVLALEQGRVGECYHLVTENLSLFEVISRGLAVSGLKGRILRLPDWLLRINEALMSVLERVLPVHPYLCSESLRSASGRVTMTVELGKAQAELGWAPGPIDDCLRELLADELALRGRALPPQLQGIRPRLS